ncbi:aromatic ring-hydroxylating dioxygenase subunit alpha [Lysobacter koreensis]|uniref:Aromatic ring-hydroxylating dioxygenase subunit alpha n=1 Tax=Lysobacter koreensis TaxID=266122 RepID=A0ABW2YPJ8_9GAMM
MNAFTAAPTPPADLAAQPLDHATALPARFYADPAMVALDRRAIFDRGWQLLAHVCQLKDPGDHVIADFAGLPVIAVRGAEGTIRVFHNVCRHRAGPIASCDGLAAKSLRCRYHGWTYGLDGVLKSAPEMGTAPDFHVGDVQLPQLAVRVWQGMVFAAVDEAQAPGSNAPCFDAFVAGIDARVGADRDLENYGHHHRVGYDVACNWKVYVDNYLEGYHVPHIHPGLNKLLDYRSYVTDTAQWYSYQFSPLESGDGLYGDGDALYYWLWPNTMLNILPGRLQTNRVVPIGVDRCRVEFDFYYTLDESEEAAARRLADLRFSDEVQFEDLTICQDVQRGLSSGSYVPGRLNPLRENAVHHFHELLRGAYRDALA